jgi:hypothetical protein
MGNIMKKTIFICFISLTLIACSNQRMVSNFTTNNSNVLFAGIGQIVQLNTHTRSYHIETNNGTLKKIDETTYSICPDTLPGNLKLTLTKGIRKEEITFRIKPVPEIKVTLVADTNLQNQGLTSALNFHTFKGLRTYMENFDESCTAKIISFKITRIAANGPTDSKFITSPNRAPNDATAMAKQVKSGDVILFEDIQVKISSGGIDGGGFQRKLEDKIYYIR